MRRNVLITIGAIALLWAILAIALGSASLRLSGSSSSASAAASPACLPKSIVHSASLPGTGVSVSPEPESVTANPATQLSFQGASASAISGLTATGSESGGHSGHLSDYSQGDGASFVPEKPFTEGEQVAVKGTVDGRAVAYRFKVDTPYSTARTLEFPNETASPADTQNFYTEPGVRAPVMTVTSPDRDPAAGDIFTTNGPSPGQYGPLIYTPQGQLVWFEHLGGGETAEDLNVQSYEGQQALTWWRGKVLDLGFGLGEDVIMNSSYQTVAHVRAGNGLEADLHELQLAPHDVAWITAYNPIRCNLTSAGGVADGSITDVAIQEIDIKTGLVRWEWHALDHVAAAESEVETPSGSAPWDYFHLNSIDPVPGGNILISARSTWAAYDLQPGSGEILWRLGGNRSSFKMGAGTKTAWQHDGRVLSNGNITLFDDGSNPPIHSQSRAIQVSVNLATHEARLVSSFTHRDPPLLAASQGNVQTLPDGNSLVGYGGIPAISEYAPDGSLLFDAHLPYDQSFYRAFRHPWSAKPAAAPALLASLNNTGEETLVHASWNGATGVSAWRVLAGNSPSALGEQATVDSTGFETETALPKRYSYVEVQALDSAGHVLASSRTAQTIKFAASLESAGAQ
jgi:hypothetical protein